MLKPAEERLQPMELRLTREDLAALDRAVVARGWGSRSSAVREAIDHWKAAGAPSRQEDHPRRLAGTAIVKVTVYLLPRQILFLDEHARRMETTRSEVLRTAVLSWLDA